MTSGSADCVVGDIAVLGNCCLFPAVVTGNCWLVPDTFRPMVARVSGETGVMDTWIPDWMSGRLG